uniref:Putative sigma-70 region domain containing protein n=1 Tax=viral metagenome TaxID=1070528 RepID=A0A6M3ISB7_9ZZZZ
MGNYYLIKTISPDKINDMNVGNEKYEYVYRYPKYGKFIDMLEKCVRSLNRNQRNCVIRYYGLYGNEDEVRSQPKIAVKLKVSQNTVKYHLQQARKCLKEQLNAKYIIYKKRK